MSEVDRLKSFFDSLFIKISPLWLEFCINWCKEETLPANYSWQNLQGEVFQQWLQSDLRDVEFPTLPTNLSQKTNFTLTGTYCLQMMQVVDISKPKLWQLNKIRNSNHLTRNDQLDLEQSGTGKRMLQLTLSDGVQEVEAMEYKPIMCLNINLLPGMKIKIDGPISVRRGRLMLESKHVKVLGGEVEALLVENAAENVLARHFNLPLNENPGQVDHVLPVVVKDMGTLANVTQPQLTTNHPSHGTIPQPSKQVRRKNTEDMIDEEMDMMLEVENQLAQQPQTTKNPTVSTRNATESNLLNDSDDELFTNINIATSTQHPCTSNNLGDDFFDNDDVDAQLDRIDNKNPVPVSRPSTLSIAKLLDLKSQVTKGKFKVRAKFKSVVQKFTADEDKYRVVIQVEDESGHSMIVRVSSGILADFAGYCPEALMSLRGKILSKDESATEKVLEALQKVKDKLISLNCVMDIQINKGEQYPTIVELF